MTLQFQDRVEAGQQLAKRLVKYRNQSDVIVLALPRGGVVVGEEVASTLNAPLDLFVEEAHRENHPAPDVQGHTVILVDEGIATAATMEAAVKALRELQPARIVVATPTAAWSPLRTLRPLVDELVAVMIPANFGGVAQYYEDFSPVTEAQVREILERTGQVENEVLR